eukprot:TRINITY_DN4333_c0_g1_i3.p1 TRINITY_DN4333_c0_g1~~TRINITY_DN4333_c0_g1_i3.p1  ORF type:complete len:188 (+),score=33.69 TRINITY_DN4333_c0_g1_i3:188-751(+)
MDTRRKTNPTTIKFCVNFQSHWGDNVYISGSIDELGKWDTRKAIKMKWNDGGKWTSVLQLPASRSYFQYKYFVLREGASEPMWEEGINNRVVYSTWCKEGKSLDLNDTWGVTKIFTEAVGTKFNEDGTVRSFPGNTIVSFVNNANDFPIHYPLLLKAQELMEKVSFSKKIRTVTTIEFSHHFERSIM